jgi:hypothetical protein
MVSWSTIAYGAAVSALLAGILVALAARGQRLTAAINAALGAAAGPMIWNAILRTTQAAMPATWQDIGSGVFAFAASALLLGLGPLANARARRTLALALLAGLAAFLVDAYLY